eukprot:s3967_g5.t1
MTQKCPERRVWRCAARRRLCGEAASSNKAALQAFRCGIGGNRWTVSLHQFSDLQIKDVKRTSAEGCPAMLHATERERLSGANRTFPGILGTCHLPDAGMHSEKRG